MSWKDNSQIQENWEKVVSFAKRPKVKVTALAVGCLVVGFLGGMSLHPQGMPHHGEAFGSFEERPMSDTDDQEGYQRQMPNRSRDEVNDSEDLQDSDSGLKTETN